ncbi:MAG: pheT [Candidatus Saccharibacteria bacterium]|nr:pheT [Candidatus Saccharibacteria bacterium]
MIISLNWLKKYTDIELPVDQLAKLIGSRLVEIEEVIDLGKKYEGVVIVKVVECKPVEGSDHLNVTKVDDGGVVKDVERDENGLVQVVCGAPNVREGLMAVWLAPGVTLPDTYNDPKPVVLEARPLRGVVSNGMLASAKELALWDDHEGILELEDERTPGESFAKAYELDDYLLDIENKSLTHRPDTFGIIGFAREVAGVQGKAFKTPPRMTLEGITWPEKVGNEPTPQVTIDNPELSTRYQAVVLTNVDSRVQLSPLEIRTYLARIGVRSHSAVVDITNYMMMITGQPLHAFDYDKLKAVNNGQIDIHVRAGQTGEKLVLIDDREIELHENDIVIANGDTPVALAGAMGGRDTEIDDNTTNVLLESASFNLYNLRNTQMRHGIFSEAITRFTKGQPAELTAPVLAGAIDLLRLSAGANRASDIADAYPVKQEQPKVYTTADSMNAALGSNFTTDDIVTTLQNVEFSVSVDDKGTIAAVAPYWRADIHIAEDLGEEVGRLNGFDNIPLTLPMRDFTPVSPDSFDLFRSCVRSILARAGANEVMTYSFVHGDVIRKAQQNVDNAYRIVNSLSPDLQYYRLTLTPSLLNLIHPNSKAGYDNFALFELNKTHSKVFGKDEDGTPKETDLLALTLSSKVDEGTTYYRAKHLLDYLGASLGRSFIYAPILQEPGYDESAAFDIRRSAMVTDRETGEYIGIIGEYKSSVKKAFKLSSFTAGFELDPRTLHKVALLSANSYSPISRYPSTERDITFAFTDINTSYQQVKAQIDESIEQVKNVSIEVYAGSIYQPKDAAAKNFSFTVRFTASDRTLAGAEVNEMVAAIAAPLVQKLGATVV